MMMIVLLLGGLLIIWCIIYPLTDLWVRYLDPAVLKKGVSLNSDICLTFDDGPNPEITPFILDILAKTNTTATFFLVGSRAEKYPELVEKIINSGHEIGVHTYYHLHAYLMFLGKSFGTIQKGRQVLENLLHRPLIWFRPPWGALNLFQYLVLKIFRLKVVLWSANAADWDGRSTPTDIVQRLLQKTKSGTIIVIHDAGGDPRAPANTLAALPMIIDRLRAEGFRFVTLNTITGENK